MDDVNNTKKMKPYPIEVVIEVNQSEYKAKIMKLEPLGFYVEDQKLVLSTGTKCNVRFALPMQNVAISARAIVVKTIDSFVKPAPQKEVVRLIEIHFMSLEDRAKLAIEKFKKAINQK